MTGLGSDVPDVESSVEPPDVTRKGSKPDSVEKAVKVTTKEGHCEPETERLQVAPFAYVAAAFVVTACNGDDGERVIVVPEDAHMSIGVTAWIVVGGYHQ